MRSVRDDCHYHFNKYLLLQSGKDIKIELTSGIFNSRHVENKHKNLISAKMEHFRKNFFKNKLIDGEPHLRNWKTAHIALVEKKS